MRRKAKLRRTLLAVSLGMAVGGAPAGYADSSDYAVGVTEKLGRGIVNVLSSPLEIPCGIRDEVSDRGTGGVGSGFFKGLALFLRRVLVGATETATFVIPMEATIPNVCARKPAPAVETKPD